jgi:hypothetical protein
MFNLDLSLEHRYEMLKRKKQYPLFEIPGSATDLEEKAAKPQILRSLDSEYMSACRFFLIAIPG